MPAGRLRVRRSGKYGAGGKPWVNSNVYGNWPSERPGPEESFDLYVNYEIYQDIPAESNRSMIWPSDNTAIMIREELEAICKDPERTSAEDECFRILYGLFMDTEKRAQDGFSSLQAHAERLHAVKTSDELMALIREEGYL